MVFYVCLHRQHILIQQPKANTCANINNKEIQKDGEELRAVPN